MCISQLLYTAQIQFKWQNTHLCTLINSKKAHYDNVKLLYYYDLFNALMHVVPDLLYLLHFMFQLLYIVKTIQNEKCLMAVREN